MINKNLSVMKRPTNHCTEVKSLRKGPKTHTHTSELPDSFKGKQAAENRHTHTRGNM